MNCGISTISFFFELEFEPDPDLDLDLDRDDDGDEEDELDFELLSNLTLLDFVVGESVPRTAF